MGYRYIGAFLFLAILLLKTSAFHNYEYGHCHEEHQTPCELCVYMISSQIAETLVTNPYIIPKKISVVIRAVVVSVIEVRYTFDTPKTDLFSRPPPPLIYSV